MLVVLFTLKTGTFTNLKKNEQNETSKKNK